MNIQNWIEEMQLQLQALNKLELDYPKGENRFLPVNNGRLVTKIEYQFNVRLPSDFKEFYEYCGGLDLSDVHNGYFIVPLTTIIRARELQAPLQISNSGGEKVTPFGSDIGGNYFALHDGTGEAIYLPQGLVENSIYHERAPGIRVVAKDFGAFLERLLADVKATVNQDQEWTYMV